MWNAMADSLVQLFTACATLVTALITFVTVCFLYRQIKMQTVSTNNQVYQNFVNNSLEIDRTLIQYPQFRKYVYGNEPLDSSNPDYELIMSVEELIVDVVENIDVFKKEIPEEYVDGWDNFVELVKKSSAYDEFINHYGYWYLKSKR